MEASHRYDMTMDIIRLALCSTLAAALLCASTVGAQTQGGSKTIHAGGDQDVRDSATTPPTQPSAEVPQAPAQSAPAQAAPEQNEPEPDIGSDNAPLPGDLPAPQDNGPRPCRHLGAVRGFDARRAASQVLEVMDVDADSPASRAGLLSRTPMTTIGASGATAGELLGRSDAALRPLLVKSGQLGEDGDLIVSIDDHRVTSDSDLPDRLSRLHPGDIIYLTVLRQQHDGIVKSVKLPVTLGYPKSANASR